MSHYRRSRPYKRRPARWGRHAVLWLVSTTVLIGVIWASWTQWPGIYDTRPSREELLQKALDKAGKKDPLFAPGGAVREGVEKLAKKHPEVLEPGD